MTTASIARHERNEAMRKARNAAFYLASTVSAVARERWKESALVFVRNARAWNRELIRITRRWGSKRSYDT